MQVSVNGQDWSTQSALVQLTSAMNVSSLQLMIVSTLGGSEIVVTGSGFVGSVYCGVSGLSWSSSQASVVST